MVLWQGAEQAERRRNSVVAREVLIALPHEMPAAARQSLTEAFARYLVGRYGVAVDAALHAPRSGHDERNHHAHLLMTTRRIRAAGFAEKTRELDDKLTGPLEIEAIRAEWCEMLNACGFALEHRAARLRECAKPTTAQRPAPQPLRPGAPAPKR